MMYQIDIQNEENYPVNNIRLVQAAEAALTAQSAPARSALTIVVTDNEHIEALNRQFRQVDAPTDVLSFPADVPTMFSVPPYLGDLVIAYPYALAQAEREGHNPDDSLALLVVHGTLHLLGYDHGTSEERTAMWAAQEEILLRIGISPALVPALEYNNDEA